MSHKGEAQPTTQDTPADAWWGRLYDDGGTPDVGDDAPEPERAWYGDSLDEHYASAIAAVTDAVPVPPPRDAAGEAPDADVLNADAPDADDRAEDTLRLRQLYHTPTRSTPAPSKRLPPSWAAREPGPGLPAPGSWEAAAVAPGPAEPWGDQTPEQLPGRSAEPEPPAGPGDPDVPVVAYVGDRPPTYEGEPTAWPVADAERLDELVPDTVLDGAHYGRLTVRAASTRGDSARYRGRPRGDALLTARFGVGDDALLLAAVASSGRAVEDGHRLAWEACRAIAAAVGRSHARLVEDVRASRRGSLKSGLQRLTERADAHTQTSLHCLLLPVDPDCPNRLFFGIGSGGLFRLRDGEWQDLGPGADPPEPHDPPEPSADDTRADDVGSARFRFRASVARPGDTLLLCSVGLAEPLCDQPELARRLARRWGPSQPPPGIAAFLADAQTRVKGYADDRTVVAVWER
ncbi:protein phosphatase 2C domain-containing protein [Streptomyces sp. RB6PN25]|uniref:Protein phosphatase 2C domain-containing protein n=1 Tax=Streptomyces humicola TaxID=2953240 RepID=A0ABT1PZL6_9ACTN|nr:protein phosphatase 2C domain-containing protein [Streptomyces humicola]MCQ4083116.1 protein phosphatase 2C domain-containing protein [Streptomyces humicola]